MLVAPNVQVDRGDPLLQLEPVINEEESVAGRPVDLALGTRRHPGDADGVAAMHAYLLGYDLDPTALRKIERGDDPWSGSAPDEPDGSAAARRRSSGSSSTSAPSRAASPAGGEATGERVRAPEEHLLTCLRTYETGGEGLPPAFLDRLLAGSCAATASRAWFRRPRSRTPCCASTAPSNGSTSSSRRSPPSSTAGSPTASELRRPRHRRSPRVSSTTSSPRPSGASPPWHGHARDVRYQFFDQPLLARVAGRAATRTWSYTSTPWPREPAGRNGPPHMRRPVTCLQPIQNRVIRRYQHGDPRERDVVLEAAARRYYRIRELARPRPDRRRRGASPRRRLRPRRDRRIHLLIAFAAVDALPDQRPRHGRPLWRRRPGDDGRRTRPATCGGAARAAATT